MLINWVGENKLTKQASASMFSVLIVSFFNTGILFIIGPWNFVELGSNTGGFFSGIYTDFTDQWFMDIGGLVAETTVFSLFAPLAEFAAFWAIRVVKRMID